VDGVRFALFEGLPIVAGEVTIDLVVDHNTFDAFVLVIHRRDEALRHVSVSLDGVSVVSDASIAPGDVSAFATFATGNGAGWRWEYEYTTDTRGVISGSASRS